MNDNTSIASDFHRLYYESEKQTWKNTYWLGTRVEKCPLDLWIYEEIIFEVKPDVIIESGTYRGGTSLFISSICDLIDHGEVVTIDTEDRRAKPRHKRITYLIGSSISPEIVTKVSDFVRGKEKVMVVLDSLHDMDHVLKELRLYSGFVSRGSYLIVEDTNLNGNPIKTDFGIGPMEAVRKFLEENKEFVSDRTREKFFLTFHPEGYLLRI